MKIAVYPGTFDPITFGHIDLINRAAKIFDQVILAIAENPSKKPLFSLAERIELAGRVLNNNEKVKIQGFDGLLSNFVKHAGAQVILRGIRAVADFDYEFQLAGMNRFLNPDVETVFLMPAEKYMYISASLVREIALFKGDVSSFVPEPIAKALYDKVSA
ncbi:MAG TPA: pantetheine-phosphate adenylyltransferase [Gammaproteobacteria bacterium]|nr:pantetheine-phosphate adenylyltransferase [Gammaproteobacteria bacterium]